MYASQQVSKILNLIFFSTIFLTACGGGDKENLDSPSLKEQAIEKIMLFANDGDNPKPTLHDYTDAGVSNLSLENLPELNLIVDSLESEDVDTTEELVALTAQLGINIFPSVDAGEGKSVQANQSITVIGTAKDSDGVIVSYEWRVGSTVLATTVSFNYIPTIVGTDTLTLTVIDDDGASASDSVFIEVTEIPNQTPSVDVGEGKSVQVNQSITVTGTATDTDGVIVSYEWSVGSTVLATTASFNYTPTIVGTDTLTLTVTDNDGASTSDTFLIEVTEISNQTPLVNAGEGKSVQVNQSVTVTGTATDTDGIIVSYEWRVGSTVLATTSSFNYIPKTVGTDTLTFTVTDHDGATASDTVFIEVTANIVSKGVVGEKLSLAFNLDPFKEDTDGDGLTDEYEITQGFPALDPAKIDTSGNGVNDAEEDSDNDGLLNIDEQALYTSPIMKDTDSDGLDDNLEITYGTNPLIVDTDNDGIFDGREILNGTDPLVFDSNTNFISNKGFELVDIDTGQFLVVKVAVDGIGDLAGEVEVSSYSDIAIPGQIGKSFNINLEKQDPNIFNSAVVTLPVDLTHRNAQNPDDISIFTINPDTGAWEELLSIIDFSSSTISASTTHFSPYVVANSVDFNFSLQNVPASCSVITDPSAIPIDVALVIDSSGSMQGNDPNNLRVEASKQFIVSMKDSDRVSVIDFNGSSKLLTTLTNDQSVIRSVLDTIDSSGSTNISAGLNTALQDFLANERADSQKSIILLTDGDGGSSSSISSSLKANNIRVFTIGLGSGANQSYLETLANETNGGYKNISSANELIGIFNEFSTVFGDDGADSDNDGLTDCQEVQGILLHNIAKVIRTDPNNPDTDGDTIPDGSEITTPYEKIVYVGAPWTAFAYSDPSFGNSDSDSDGLTDLEEYQLSTNPLAKDTDADGLSDYDEYLLYETDPTNRDSDYDDLTDKEEIDRGGIFDPLGYNYTNTLESRITFLNQFEKTKAIYDLFVQAKQQNDEIKAQFYEGLILGEFEEIDNVPQLVGLLTSGFFFVGDGRDIIALSLKDDYLAAGITAVALVPLYGDSLKVVTSTVNYLEKNFKFYTSAINYLENIAGENTALLVLKKLLPEGRGRWDDLTPFARGIAMEADLFIGNAGRFLGGNFPKIDAWDQLTGTATSFKTIDTSLKSYNTPQKFAGKLKTYAKDLALLRDETRKVVNSTDIVTVKRKEVEEMVLKIGIPDSLPDEYIDLIKSMDIVTEQGGELLMKVKDILGMERLIKMEFQIIAN